MAPPADQAFHVKINGKGYLLVDQSYIRRSQLPFTPRFSTGDYGYGDLSFWQFILQESWDGGQGQAVFNQKNKIMESVGWDFSDYPNIGLYGVKLPRLSGGSETASGVSALAQLNRNWYNVAQLVRFGRQGNATTKLGRLMLTGAGASSPPTITSKRAASASLAGISQVDTDSMGLWQRIAPGGGLGGIFLAVHGVNGTPSDTVTFYDEALASMGTYVITNAAGSRLTPFVYFPYTTNKIFLFGKGNPIDGTAGVESVAYNLMEITANAWTANTNVMGWTGDAVDQVIPMYAVDSAGTVYFASFTETAFAGDITSDHIGSTLFLFAAVDMADTAGPHVTEKVNYPDVIITGIVSISGVVYIIGSHINRVGGAVETQDIVMKFPNTIIWQNRLKKTNVLPNNLPKAVSQVNRAEAVFVTDSSLGGYASIMHIVPGDIVEEVGVIPLVTPDVDCGYMAIAQMGPSYYLYDATNNILVRMRPQSNLSRQSTAPLVLELSSLGGNTAAIQKSLYKVIVELTIPIPINDTMNVQVNGVPLGVIVNSDGTRKEFTPAQDVVSSGFSPKFIMQGGSQWTGRVVRVVVQYIPTQLKKRAWGMAIRVMHSQKLLNDQRDQREAIQMLQDLEAAWKANSPVSFTDTDGATYNVIVTDMSSRQPIIGQIVKKREYIVSLELLEI